MRSAQIKADLGAAGSSIAILATELGVTKNAVRCCIAGSNRSRRIEKAIADLIKKPLHEVFPKCYTPPPDYQPPDTVEISAVELAELRLAMRKAQLVLDRLPPTYKA